jgi:uncharacterized protein (TIGR00251 family)
MGSPNLKPIEQLPEGVLVRLRIQPQASRNEIVGLHGNAVKIRISATPIDGAANDALIRFLAEQLDVPRSAVRLLSGASSRSKTIMVSGARLGDVTARLSLNT